MKEDFYYWESVLQWVIVTVKKSIQWVVVAKEKIENHWSKNKRTGMKGGIRVREDWAKKEKQH